MAEAHATLGHYDKATMIYKQLIDSNKTKLSDARYFGFTNIRKMFDDSLDFKIFNTKINTQWNELNGVIYNNGLVYESNQFANTTNKKKFFLLNLLQSKRPNKLPEFAWDGAGFSQLFFYSNLDSVRTEMNANSYWKEKLPLKNYTDYSTITPNDTRKIVGAYILQKADSFTNQLIQKFDVFARDKMNLGAVSFTADGKKLPGCTNLSVSGASKTCRWKPTTRKQVNLSARLVPTNSAYSTTSASLSVLVISRTGAR
jgi:hypothetical protein